MSAIKEAMSELLSAVLSSPQPEEKDEAKKDVEVKEKRVPKSKSKPVSAASRSGIVFPVGRMKRFMRQRQDYYTRVSNTAPVYMAAVLEYLAAEILTSAGNVARYSKLKRIKPRHINIAIHDDEEFYALLKGCTVGHGGGFCASVKPEHLPAPSNGGKTKPKSKTKAKPKPAQVAVAQEESKTNVADAVPTDMELMFSFGDTTEQMNAPTAPASVLTPIIETTETEQEEEKSPEEVTSSSV